MMQYRIQPSNGLKGSCRPPGDKSITHRALIFSAIASGHSTISHPCKGDDIESTIQCLEALGIHIRRDSDHLYVCESALRQPNTTLDCGNSGTTMRLLMGLLAAHPIKATLTGDASLRQRPMKRITAPLLALGVQFDSHNPPITMTGTTEIPFIDYEMAIPSAQIKTSLALTALQSNGGSIRGGGSSRDHSSRLLHQMGCKLHFENGDLDISASKLSGINIFVPGDFSAAAFLIVGALIVPGSNILLIDVNLNPTRTGLLTALNQMGAQIDIAERKQSNGEIRGNIRVKHSDLVGWECSPELIPTMIDELPLLAVLGAYANGVTRITNAAELRVKESDRIKCICTGLRNLGAVIEETHDGFSIIGPQALTGGNCFSFGDHRIAMSLSIAAMVAKGPSVIQDIDCVGTSFPNYVDLIQRLSPATLFRERAT